MLLPEPPGRSLMSVRGNAASRGMTAHDRIRLTGPFAELDGCTNDSPGRETFPAGADHLVRTGGGSRACAPKQTDDSARESLHWFFLTASNPSGAKARVGFAALRHD